MKTFYHFHKNLSKLIHFDYFLTARISLKIFLEFKKRTYIEFHAIFEIRNFFLLEGSEKKFRRDFRQNFEWFLVVRKRPFNEHNFHVIFSITWIHLIKRVMMTSWIWAKISTFWYENIHISVLDLCIVLKLLIYLELSFVGTFPMFYFWVFFRKKNIFDIFLICIFRIYDKRKWYILWFIPRWLSIWCRYSFISNWGR